jgi:hypothetical protein
VTGETGYSAETLDLYRRVAMWAAASQPKSVTGSAFPWADASWTAHLEAYRNGISWAEFVAGKRTKRAVRQQAGASTGDVPAAAKAINARPDEAAKLVRGLNKEAKAKLAAELNRTSTVRAALDDEQFLTKVVESMSPDQRRKVSREVNIQEHERLEERRRTEGGGRRVTRDPIGEKAIEVWRTNGEVIGKLHEAFRLLASVSSEWVTYAGKFRTDLAAQAILDIKAEVGVLCMYAGIPDEENGGIFTDFADPDSTPES